MTPLLVAWHLGRDGHGAGLVLLVWAAGGFLVLSWWYAVGLSRVLSHERGRRRYRWRAGALLLAVASVSVVTVPPLGDVLEERLATHMVQHLVLIMVAAPLLAVAAPGQVLLAGMWPGWRRRVVRGARRLPAAVLVLPHLAWAAHIAALWIWHLPGPYDAAVASAPVHLLEHATFFVTAWLFWWHLVRLGRHRLRGPAAALYVLAAVPPGAALGAVLTFPDHPLYPAQAARAVAVGADPLLDQRIGGLVMWIPLDFAYLGLAIWIFGRWLNRASAPSGLPSLPADATSPREPAPSLEASR